MSNTEKQMFRDGHITTLKSDEDKINYYKGRCSELHYLLQSFKTDDFDKVCSVCYRIDFYNHTGEESLLYCFDCNIRLTHRSVCVDCATQEELNNAKICKYCETIYCKDCIGEYSHYNICEIDCCSEYLYDTVEKISNWYLNCKRIKLLNE